MESGQALIDLLVGYKLNDQKGCAVAVNQEVIPRDKWGDKELNHKDEILVIKATQGG
ncbi:MAG: sulfur carrier protein ThiS [Flavobacteriales bacterium]|nr:sulfur carrier protein ThiS [Flavobacteriales bacterium]